MAKDAFVIAQLSDIHCGDPRFDSGLMQSIILEIGALEPDLVVVLGDLTRDGYAEQFDEAAEWIEHLSCAKKIVVPGNHDARNVGFTHFQRLFPPAFHKAIVPLPKEMGEGLARIIGVDTSRPDLDQGELGRDSYAGLYHELGGSDEDLKVLVMHHHLVSVPGTGRERNILWDAGDLLEILNECHVDLVLCGHRHVPYVWRVNEIVVAMSGTACTHRTRGRTPPSFNIIRVFPEAIEVTMRNAGLPTRRVSVFPRRVPLELGVSHRRRGTMAMIGAGL